MRIGVTSDIHVDITTANWKIVEHLVRAAMVAELDVLVICGDIAPNLNKFAKTLLAFQKLPHNCKKLFVAGNHDIWIVSDFYFTSDKKYEVISDICKECGFHHLGNGAFVLDDIGFCGTIGWYDYSFKKESYGITDEQYAKKEFGDFVWNDLHYARWRASDIELSKRFEGELQRQIESIRSKVSKLIIATHHVPFQEGVVYNGKLPWDFFSAFMGSRSLGEICKNEPRVTHVLFGHSHSRFQQKINGLMAICSPVGYLYDTPKESLPALARERLTLFSV